MPFSVVVLLVFCCVQNLHADNDHVEIRTVEHKSSTYDQKELRIVGDMLIVEGPVRTTLQLSDVLSIRIKHSKTLPNNHVKIPTAGVRLVNDDWLNVSPTKTNESALLVEWPHHTTLSVSLESIRYLGLSYPQNKDKYWPLIQQLEVMAPGNDRLFMKSGSPQHGTLISIDSAHVKLQAADQELKVPRDDVHAISIDPDLTFIPESKGLSFLCLFADGSHITGKQLQIIDSKVTLSAEFGARLSVPISSVLEIRVLGGRAIYLSDMTPKRSRITPFFTVKRRWKRNRNIIGRPMLVAGKPVMKGIGVTSHTELEYSLEKQFESFAAKLAIDDAAGNKGHATFSVFVDDDLVQTGEIPGKIKPIEIGPHEVSSAKSLKLVVGFGRRGDVLDYVNWCDPVLVKKGRPHDAVTPIPMARDSD